MAFASRQGAIPGRRVGGRGGGRPGQIPSGPTALWNLELSFLKTQVLLRRVASSSAPEQEFWRAVGSLAREARPNWDVDLNSGRAPLAADSFVYLVNPPWAAVINASFQCR